MGLVGVRWAETRGTGGCDGCGMLRRIEGHWEEQGLPGAVGIDSPQGGGCQLLRNPNVLLPERVWYMLVLPNKFA